MTEWVQVGLCQKHWELLWRSLKGFVGVLPQQFHVVPVFDDAVAHRILHFQESLPLGVQLLANHDLGLVAGGDHHLVLGPTDAKLATGSTWRRRLWASLRRKSLP